MESWILGELDQLQHRLSHTFAHEENPMLLRRVFFAVRQIYSIEYMITIWKSTIVKDKQLIEPMLNLQQRLSAAVVVGLVGVHEPASDRWDSVVRSVLNSLTLSLQCQTTTPPSTAFV